MVEQFHVGQRVRLRRTLTTQPKGLFPKGATGTVTNVGGVGLLDGEIPVWMRMDQHFPSLELSCSCGVAPPDHSWKAA